jgi:hypothetical protein
VHALRNIHAALAPYGFLVDSEPVGARPSVTAKEGALGNLDLSMWAQTVASVDERLDETIAAGLYELLREQHFLLADTFDNGPECADTVSGWQGTRVPPALAARIRTAGAPVRVTQDVRLRLFRCLPTSSD